MPIRCDEYDKIEIVCMFHYPVTLVCKDGSRISGIAKDTKRNESKDECIALRVGDEDLMTLVVLTSLISMTIDVDNTHFHSVFFSK